MKMTGVDRLFVDTNILIYATNASSPWHGLANAAIQEARQLGIELIISTQVLREYLATATRLSVTGSGIPLADIFENLQTFQREFTVVEDTRSVAAALENLARSVAVAGKQVHDANIVAAMQIYAISRLLTFNANDFKSFSITILDPASV